ncbi:MAG: response regulator, partial [Sulfurimonas sp.]
MASDGEETVHVVTSGEVDFDLILMDINMPVMDGYTATSLIRQDCHYDGVPIVSFTALILDSEKQKMFGSGINAILSKPLNIGKLYTVFSMYMSDQAFDMKKKEDQKEMEAVFEGLDIKSGIGHANHNEALYIEVLKEFREIYGNSYEVFSRLAEEKSYEQMKMLCIDLRGLTGTIGALELQHLISK